VIPLTLTFLTVASCSGNSDTGNTLSSEEDVSTTEQAQATTAYNASPDPRAPGTLPSIRFYLHGGR